MGGTFRLADGAFGFVKNFMDRRLLPRMGNEKENLQLEKCHGVGVGEGRSVIRKAHHEERGISGPKAMKNPQFAEKFLVKRPLTKAWT